METIIFNLILIIISIQILALLICFYLLYRNEKVEKFCFKMIVKGKYEELPPYSTMLYSLKPLKEKYWIK